MGSANIDQVAAQTSGALTSFGSIEDWSRVGTKLITTNLIQQIYFVRCAHIPIFYIVQFYNPGSGWQVIDLRFTTYNEGKANGRSMPSSRRLSSGSASGTGTIPAKVRRSAQGWVSCP